MASSSNTNASARTQEDLEYLCPINATVTNFVSVKLSNERNYHLWEMQMLCLLESYNIRGIVYATCVPPERKQYDSLVKGWIFGSISEGLLATVVDLGSAKDVWNKLKSFYGPITSSQQVLQPYYPAKAQTKLEAKTEPEDKDVLSREIITEDDDADQTDTETKEIESQDNNAGQTVAETETKETKSQDKDVRPIDKKEKGKDKKTYGEATDEDKIKRKKMLCKAILEGSIWELISILSDDKDAIKEAINSDGNTMLHIAVGISRNFSVRMILASINKREQLSSRKDETSSLSKITEMQNLQGSTALHIAAIVGNTEAANLLINRNTHLLEISDNKNNTPLDKAFEYMHLDTIECLLKASNDGGNPKKKAPSLMDSSKPEVNRGVDLLVNAISEKQYDLAKDVVKRFPDFVVENDNVLLAIARTFPNGLDYGEKLVYPILDDVCKGIVDRANDLLRVLVSFYDVMMEAIRDMADDKIRNITLLALLLMLGAPLLMLYWIYKLILLVILMVYFPFFMFYFLLWKAATRVVAPIKHIEEKKREWEEAAKVLKLVCDEINKLNDHDRHRRFYTRPVLEAARQNAYEVVDEILSRSPEAIRFEDENGHDIIQLAVMHRSEKIYNLIYIIPERKNDYRTIQDTSLNNMLHLAGRLAPSHKLKRSRGAAFQLQRELQWREEVETLVLPSYITKENIFKETPDMVFTREHENLVKEGEKWMKAVAESCSITAALITTIVFAAAITVPGGSNQNTGIPLFTENIAFTIFAISDAISLFASSTTLLMFLSILTGRFAEKDFLVSLPRRLIIGLCTLTLSTTAMMVAFGATLFLVFCQKRPWMLAPICVLAVLPIVSFGTLQIPLIVDLFRSTYARIFGKQSNNGNQRFNPNDIRLFFGK